MKKLLFLGIGSALVFTMGGVGPAQADNGPHMSGAATTVGKIVVSDAAGKCAACHKAHTGQAEYLLKQAQPALCYTCHDGTGVASTDVKDGQLPGPGGAALRGGGFVTAAIDSGSANSTWIAGATAGTVSRTLPTIPTLAKALPVTSRHQIDGTTSGTAWGNGANGSGLGKSLTLECGSCHDPHGNGNYRILKPIPVDSGTSKTTDSLGATTTGVNIPDATSKGYTTTNYWLTGDASSPAGGTTLTGTPKVAGVNGATTTDPATDGYIQNIAAWCTTCHTRYLAPTQSYKTASGDATFMYRHRGDANYKQGAANCITCHVSHGSNAVMNNANNGGAADVTLPGGASATTLVGATTPDSRLLRVNNRGTCEMCHNV
jgi:predicted CXXCH cytochrome family protein